MPKKRMVPDSVLKSVVTAANWMAQTVQKSNLLNGIADCHNPSLSLHPAKRDDNPVTAGTFSEKTRATRRGGRPPKHDLDSAPEPSSLRRSNWGLRLQCR